MIHMIGIINLNRFLKKFPQKIKQCKKLDYCQLISILLQLLFIITLYNWLKLTLPTLKIY